MKPHHIDRWNRGFAKLGQALSDLALLGVIMALLYFIVIPLLDLLGRVQLTH